MNSNFLKILCKAPAIATASFAILVSIPSFAHAASLSTHSNQSENKQLIAQACQNTEVRLTNKSFPRGTKWSTCNGYFLIFQPDGNLVLYSPQGVAKWATGTVGLATSLALQPDGNLVLYNSNNVPLWASDTSNNAGAFFSLQTDGNFVVYSSSYKPLWASYTENGRVGTLSASAIWISSHTSQIALPFRSGETWYVCQGYRGTISHQNSFSLDLSIGQDFGINNACYGYQNRSANRLVLAPASGKISHINSDLVCLSIDSNRSMLIGHINRSVPHGANVKKGDVLGTTSWAGPANNYFSHIHLEGRRGAGCPIGKSIPLTAANGFQIQNVGDLVGELTHWKRALTRP